MMNFIKITAILLFSSTIIFTSCNESTTADIEVSTPETITPAEVPVIPTPTNATIPSPPTTKPAQNEAGVWHYTCTKGCTGGAGSALNCNTCGNLLVHNAAYHPAPSAAPSQNLPTTPNMAPGQSNPEPAQNAVGVWHYTCQKGCAGGAGSANPCNTCGTILVHNATYHQ